MLKRKYYFAVLTALSVVLTGCGNLVSPTARYGMVKNPDTGLQIGSVVEKSLVTDASFYKNKTIKVRTRNTSGDVAFDLREFTDRLRTSYSAAGYTPTDKDDFGLLVDVNVIYSGQIQTNLADEFSFLGGAAGGIAGARSDARFGPDQQTPATQGRDRSQSAQPSIDRIRLRLPLCAGSLCAFGRARSQAPRAGHLKYTQGVQYGARADYVRGTAA